MKKLLSILLAAMIVCSMLSVLTFTASAETRIGSEDIEKRIDKMKPGDTLDINDIEVYFDDDDNGRIDIGESKDWITLNFHNVDFVNAPTDPCTDSFFEINADHVTMNFYDCNFKTKVGAVDTGKIVVTQEGSAIYVDGANCVLNGHGTTEFNGCGTKSRRGGAIFVDDDDDQVGCRILGFTFRNCDIANENRYHFNSDYIHGCCIYAAANDCSIVDCYFDTHNWETQAQYVPYCVTSKTGDTVILGGDPNDYILRQRIGPDRSATRYENCKIMIPEDITEGANNHHRIYTALNEAYCLDISWAGNQEGKENGANIQLFKDAETWAQKFHIIKDNGRYIIKSDDSGKVLDVEGGRGSNGANVYQWEDLGGDNQRWYFVPAGDGYYYIFSGLGTCLNAIDGATNRGNVNTWSFNADGSQKFKLVEYDQDNNLVTGSSQATGSVLSEGNLWIIIAVAAVVVIGVVALILIKKKKTPATANGAPAETKDDEE